MNYKCIIFDCDGVLVDSESISARIFQQMANELGFRLTYEDAVAQFAGTSMKENLKFVEDHIQRNLPDNFEMKFRNRTYEMFKSDLQPVDGIHELIENLTVPYCVASSGPMEKIRLNLTKTKLIHKFEGRIFSSYDIGSWKPEPEIFIHAARQMGFKPEECFVIEDSAPGIKAAIAGGFKVYALSDKNKKDAFKQLGANPFCSMAELSNLLNLRH